MVSLAEKSSNLPRVVAPLRCAHFSLPRPSIPPVAPFFSRGKYQFIYGVLCAQSGGVSDGARRLSHCIPRRLKRHAYHAKFPRLFISMANSLPPGISSDNSIGLGTTGLAAPIPDSRRVIKIPHSEPDAHARCAVEAKMYERLTRPPENSSPTILRYYGRDKYGIILEYAENGGLRQYMRKVCTPSNTLILRWARQAAQALLFCHENHVLHGDIN
jgi:hypothetical protein